MSEVRSPTVRRRELGAMLRGLRLEKGMTVDQVAERLLCSSSKVSRMETGQRSAALRDIRDLCDLYGVSDHGRERLMDLARESKQQGWWQNFALPYSTFVGLEQEATSMKLYQSAVVPGIFQVSDYSRALHRVAVPSFEESVIEERVEERRRRKQVLTRDNPPQVEVVIDEAALRRPIGGFGVMREQLSEIVQSARLPNVTIQLLPFSRGAHPALESDFVILSFGGTAPNVVHVEGLAGQFFLEKSADLERYLTVFEVLQGMALSPQDSDAHIEQIRDTSYTSDLGPWDPARSCGLMTRHGR